MWNPTLESSEDLRRIKEQYTAKEEAWVNQWKYLSALCDDDRFIGNLDFIRRRMKIVMTQEAKCCNKAYKAHRELLRREILV
jgi:hypothetical protein